MLTTSRTVLYNQLRRSGQFRRFLQVQASPQVFLEPVESHPGITCLSLNRPQSRNAISMALLQVNSRTSPSLRQDTEINCLQQLRESLETAHFDNKSAGLTPLCFASLMGDLVTVSEYSFYAQLCLARFALVPTSRRGAQCPKPKLLGFLPTSEMLLGSWSPFPCLRLQQSMARH